jgi:pseudouridine-5'-phosphate glycosidase
MKELLQIAPEVAAALAAGRPVVALESTIISHGMPYPENLQMAKKVEGIIREEGAVPATIALMDGKVKVGLEPADLERLATEPNVAKVSLRDMPIIIAKRQTGATTVATTTIAAEAAGIKVFVTGGIGGVHRGAPGSTEQVWDVSADLTVLGRSPVTVVCAGCKSILDIPATLEYLETLGVTVLGYKTDDFPGFYTRTTGYGVDGRADSPAEAAAVIAARQQLGLQGGVLLVNPVPEEAALDAGEVEAHIQGAMREMARQGITGKRVTPFLLAKMKEVTAGKSLAANLALVYHNALVGAQVAVALAGQ